mgnify:CR=1 FL=1
MQNTILIHAPGRRQGRGALVLAYTALFALLMGIWAAIFALNGQSFIQYGDTLKQHYPFLVYYGRWLRQAVRCVLTGAAMPTWDFSIGYGADIITTLSYYGLGDPLDLLAAFVPGRWTEQLLEGLIVLRLYLAGLAFMAFSRRHGNSRFGTLLGALAYVFSAWPIQAGLIEPVFLVPMYCFPLMLLGADDLFEGRSPVLYIAAIALTALSNFLFFYMAAMLLVLYAIAVYSKRYGAKNLRTLPPLLAKFIGFALVGIAISAVTLLPTAQELFGSARFGLTRETAPYPFYRFFELLANMTTGMGYDAYSTYAGVTSAAFLGVLVLFAKPRQNTVLKCAWLGLLALLLVPQAGSVLNGISYVSNRWVWAFTMLEAFILARVCPGITAFEPKEKRNLFALLAVYCVVAFCVKQGRTETALLGALLLAAGATLAQQTLLPNGHLLTCLMLTLGFCLLAARPGGTGVCRVAFALRLLLPVALVVFAGFSLSSASAAGLFPLLGAGVRPLLLAALLGLSAGSPKVGMATVSGGEMGMLADVCSDSGLIFPPISEAGKERLRKVLPPYAPTANPLDAWGSGDLREAYPASLGILAAEEDVETLIVSQDIPGNMAPEQMEQFSDVARAAVSGATRPGSPPALRYERRSVSTASMSKPLALASSMSRQSGGSSARSASSNT